jgi:hypothetical protein|tara:strand:+ start:523 stop:1329 length:807 start_codon:yes stop_codon:yes gene_type:complete
LKTLIVQSDIRDQTIFENQPSSNDYVNALEIAKNSVRVWADKNGYDYHCSVTPVLAEHTFDDIRKYPPCSAYYEFQKLFQDISDYDRICWLDPDVVVLGNPQLDDSWFSIRYNGKLAGTPHLRPNSGCFYGCKQAFTDLYNYAKQQLSYETRNPDYQAWLDADVSPKRNSTQALMTFWVAQHTNSIKPMTKHLHTFFTYDTINNNSFVHLVGNNKYFKLCLLRWLLKADDVTRAIMYDILNAQEVDEVQHTNKWYLEQGLANKQFVLT